MMDGTANSNVEVNQRTAFGSTATQIGVQNVYQGLSPTEACALATQLFYDNFPKLQEYARKIVDERISELMDEIAKKLNDKKIQDMSPFADPDVQYATYEAQKSYARFGSKDRLSILAELIASRVQHNSGNILLKTSIDKAIEIAPMLTSSQLDTLSLLSLTNQIQLSSITSLESLQQYVTTISDVFKNADLSKQSTLYLVMIGAMQFQLHNAYEFLARTYGLNPSTVKSICPELILKLSGDFLPSQPGIILGSINASEKLGNINFDYGSLFSSTNS